MSSNLLYSMKIAIYIFTNELQHQAPNALYEFSVL
jgi:hypothetical protein